jgi:hypothetical protein
MPLAADQRSGCGMEGLFAHDFLSSGLIVLVARDASGLALRRRIATKTPIVVVFRNAVAE